LTRLNKINEQGVTILMVEQNARTALAISDRGYNHGEGVLARALHSALSS
jgi:ABC-type branched-subunit amino acid transport system ATPase component